MTAQLVIILFSIMASGMMGIFRWYQKKKVLMDAERAARDREQAILRTGRDPLAESANRSSFNTGSAPTQRPREADLMAERQEALRQLRNQQAQATNAQPQQRDLPQLGGSGPITKELWPGGPVIVINGPAPAPAQSPNANRPMPRPSQPQQDFRRAPQMAPQRPQQQRQPLQKAKPVQKRQQQPQRPPQFPASTEASRIEARHDSNYLQRERSLARMQASTNIEEAVVAAPPIFIKPTTPQQWRAALIAAEIFGTPVSMRDPGTPIGCPTL